MRGTHGSAQHGCPGDDQSGRGLGGKAVHGLQLEDAVAHGLDDLPAADGRTGGHGHGAGQLDPQGHGHFVDLAEDEQGQGDDAHGLLGVIEAVAGGHEGRGHQLHLAEDAVDLAAHDPREDPVDEPHDEEAHPKARQRREHQRQQHLVDDTGKIEGIGPGMGQSSTHQAADERMGGRRGDAEIPGEAVPEDGAQQGRQHEDMAALDHFGQNKARPEGLGHLGAQQGPGQVEGGRHAHGKAGRHHLGGDHGGDGIGAVVRAVGKVEYQGDKDDQNEQERDLKHSSAPLLRWFQPDY